MFMGTPSDVVVFIDLFSRDHRGLENGANHMGVDCERTGEDLA